jgi:hypothetical protein
MLPAPSGDAVLGSKDVERFSPRPPTLGEEPGRRSRGASILVHNAAIFPKGGIIGFIRSLARRSDRTA